MGRGAQRREVGSPAETPVSVAAVVARFAALTIVAGLAVALGIAVATRSAAEEVAIAEARQAAVVSGKGIVEPLVTDLLVAGDAGARASLDEVVRRTVLQGSLVRVKLWTPDGVVVYSDEPRLIGSRFTLDDGELDVLRSGEVHAEATDLSAPENRFEPGRELLEVYLPIATPSGTPLLFEAYFEASGVEAARQSLWQRFAPIALGGLLVVALVQLPVAWSMARRLRRQQDQRERLLRHAIDASQAERRRIAGDLHDGPVQDLAGVALSLAAALRRPPGEPIDDEVVATAAADVRRGVDGLRTLLIEIVPPTLDAGGWPAAVGDLLDGVARAGTATELDIDLPGGLPEHAAQLLYRGTQEALRNVAAHAGAAHVVVRAWRDGDLAVVQVDDDGRGFATEVLAERAGQGHVGLRSLLGLFAEAGGSLTVRSAPGRGTLVDMRVPVT